MSCNSSSAIGPIGVFDSGYGGLTILKEIRRVLPDYDYLYLGDNARAPYGTRSFDVVYEFTLQAVRYLFAQAVSWSYWLATRPLPKRCALFSSTTSRLSTHRVACLASYARRSKRLSA